MTIEALYRESIIEEATDIATEKGYKIGFEKGYKIGFEKGFEIGLEEAEAFSIRQMLLNEFEAKMVANILDLDLKKVLAVEVELHENGELKE